MVILDVIPQNDEKAEVAAQGRVDIDMDSSRVAEPGPSETST